MRWSIALGILILILASAFAAGVIGMTGGFGPLGVQSPAGKNTTADKQSGFVPHTNRNATLASNASVPVPDQDITVLANGTYTLAFSRKNITVNASSPPFTIDITVAPKMVSDTKWFVNRTLRHREEIVTVPRVSDNAFLAVTVADLNGAIVASDGFGKTDSMDTHRTLQIYQAGKYVVNLYGNDVTVHSMLSMAKPGYTGTAP